MDGPGFHVEIGVLESTATGIAESVGDQQELQLKRLDGPEVIYGHSPLGRSMENFCDRWSSGLDILFEDAQEVGATLTDAAQAYREADEAAAGRLTSDPAVPVIDD
jgi:hypothetical protein